MIIVKVMGGLGNQMQQYAMYRKLLHLGKQAKLDISWFLDPEVQKNALAPRNFELSYFRDLPMEFCTDGEREKFLGKGGFSSKLKRKLGLSHVFEESRMYHPEIFSLEDAYLVGYFACNKYYADIMEELQNLFLFPESSDPGKEGQNRKLKSRMQDGSEISCAVHIRRGDYLDSANAGILGGICTEEYYEGAAEYLERETKSEGKPIHFYVFSDDPEFAALQRFGTKGEECTPVNINTGKDCLLDIDLMRSCRCIICANSTFSFWGARLNPRPDRILIRPLYHRNNQVPDPARMHDLWAGFVLVDRNGEIE